MSDEAGETERLRQALREAEEAFYEIANRCGSYIDVMTPKREFEFLKTVRDAAGKYGDDVRKVLRESP